MTGIVSRSPRTPATPMAFTAWEFCRGALLAWMWFLVYSTGLHVVLLGFWAILVPGYTVPWSFGALVVGSPVALLLGWALRRVRRMSVHALAFTLLGAAIGAGTTFVALTVPWSDLSEGNHSYIGAYILIVFVSATIAVPFGWWQTARRALRDDRGRTIPVPTDVVGRAR